MSLIGRIFVVFFALILSLVAAGLGLAVGVMLPDFITLNSDPVEKFSFFAMAFFTTGFAGAYAFVPALVLIAVAETFDIRSVFFYAIGGGLIALMAYYNANISVALENTTDISPVAYGMQLVAACGIIGGFVYWLIAGRRAGRWKNPFVAI